MKLPRGRSGQSVAELTLMLPLFLFLAFAVVQTCHLGIAVVILNYGASSVAREAAAGAARTGGGQARLQTLMMAGLKNPTVKETVVDDKKDNVTANMAVLACAELAAYPFIGPMLFPMLPANPGPCEGGGKVFGPVSLRGPAPYTFIVHGKAKARMNYIQKD